MSYVSLPNDFDANTGECRGYQIAKQRDGELLPIGFLRGGADLPCDLRKLAENFASILNGKDPIYKDGRSHDMYFERHAEGLSFRFKDPRVEGVSHACALFTCLSGIELEFDDEA